jgi:hypothetical protein
VPVLLVFTKFDVIFSQALFDIAGGDSQDSHKRAKDRAHATCEESCRHLLGKQTRDIPAVVVSSTCFLVCIARKGCLTPSVVYSEVEIW